MMKIKFGDGSVVEVSSPREQKVEKSDGTSGWMLSFTVLSPITSTQADLIFSDGNISNMTVFDSDAESGQIITGYHKISNITIRYGTNGTSSADVQLTKNL